MPDMTSLTRAAADWEGQSGPHAVSATPRGRRDVISMLFFGHPPGGGAMVAVAPRPACRGIVVRPGRCPRPVSGGAAACAAR